MHNSILVFDIETIPDDSCCENLTGEKPNDINEAREKLIQYHLEITDGKNSFLRQPFHKIVAISFLLCDVVSKNGYETYDLVELRSGGTIDSKEYDLISGFFSFIEKHKPRLISFNGRTFDIPVLKYRAMMHLIQSRYFYLSGDKWNNYNQRYSSDWHCDLLEVLSDYGASARVKMHEVCAILGIPGKFGLDGSKVLSMHDEGKVKQIRDYCETDVINTYIIYLRFMHHTGRISMKSYDYAIEKLVDYLYNESKDRPHLQEFLRAWGK